MGAPSRVLDTARLARWRVDEIISSVYLNRSRPGLAAVLDRSAADAASLEAAHRAYTTTISTPVMAVSLRTAGVLRALCAHLEPHQLLDLGSGFSTYVFADWMRTAARTAELISYDDDTRWLEATRDYLASHRLGDVPDLRKVGEGPFPTDNDLIFLDLGLPPQRIGSFAEAAAALSPTGILVIDDTNQHPFGAQVKVGALPNGVRVLSLRRHTRDEFGRFASLAVRR